MVHGGISLQNHGHQLLRSVDRYLFEEKKNHYSSYSKINVVTELSCFRNLRSNLQPLLYVKKA